MDTRGRLLSMSVKVVFHCRVIGTFRSDYDYEYDFWAREAWVLAVVDTVVAVVFYVRTDVNFNWLYVRKLK